MQSHFRPQIQNGPIAKRPRRHPAPTVTSPSSSLALPSKAVAAGLQARARLRALSPAAAMELLPSRVLVTLLVCGALIAAGFVFGLHEHFVAYAFGRDEVKVQTKIEQSTSEQRALKAEQRQAVSPFVLARTAESQGRVQPIKLDPAKPGAKPKSQPKPEH